MKKLEHLFGGLDMNWKRLLVFALLAGAYTGLINQVPVLAGAAVAVCLLCVQQSRSESSISQQLPAGYDSCTLQVNDGSRVEIDAASGTFTYYYNPVRAQDNVLTFTRKDGSALVYQVVRDGSMVRLEEQKSR